MFSLLIVWKRSNFASVSSFNFRFFVFCVCESSRVFACELMLLPVSLVLFNQLRWQKESNFVFLISRAEPFLLSSPFLVPAFLSVNIFMYGLYLCPFFFGLVLWEVLICLNFLKSFVCLIAPFKAVQL